MIEKNEEELLRTKLSEHATGVGNTTLGDLLVRYLYSRMPKVVIADVEKAALTGAKVGGYKEAMSDIQKLTERK